MMKRSYHLLLIICLLSLPIYVHSSTLLAADTNQIQYVGGNGRGNHTSIQAAVDNASIHSHIFVYNGIYLETITIPIAIVLEGENPLTTIINGQEKDSVIHITTDNVTIKNFTIKQGFNAFPEASIAIHSNNNNIVNNTLENSFYGIVLLHASYNQISNNFISHNNQCGIYFSSSNHNTLTNNIVDTQPFNGFGIYDFSDNNLIENNTFLHNQLYGVNIRDSYNNQIIGNTMANNTMGLHLPQPQFHTTFASNTFYDNEIAIVEQPTLMYTALPECLLLMILALFIFRIFIFRS